MPSYRLSWGFPDAETQDKVGTVNSTTLPTIRDPDLLHELERSRGTLTFTFVERDLARQQAKRDELAALPRDKRRRVMTASALEFNEPTKQDLRHIHSVLAICGLPYDRLPVAQRNCEPSVARVCPTFSFTSLSGSGTRCA